MSLRMPGPLGRSHHHSTAHRMLLGRTLSHFVLHSRRRALCFNRSVVSIAAPAYSHGSYREHMPSSVRVPHSWSSRFDGPQSVRSLYSLTCLQQLYYGPNKNALCSDRRNWRVSVYQPSLQKHYYGVITPGGAPKTMDATSDLSSPRTSEAFEPAGFDHPATSFQPSHPQKVPRNYPIGAGGVYVSHTSPFSASYGPNYGAAAADGATRAHGVAMDGSSTAGPEAWVVKEVRLLRHLLESSAIGGSMMRRVVIATLTGVGILTGLALYNWDYVKSVVGREGAEVVRAGMRDQELQYSANAFSKQLINNMLEDDRLQVAAAAWVNDILNSEVVLSRVQRIAEGVVRDLCANPDTIQQVSTLLLRAINLESAISGAAAWSCLLLQRTDVREAVVTLVNATVLDDDTVRRHAEELARVVVAGVVSDPETANHTRQHVQRIVQDPAFQTMASDALWSVLKQTLSPGSLSTNSVDEDN